MKLSVYNSLCTELAELAERATSLEGLDDTIYKELIDTKANIQANHYRITLLGSFQSGKSTIFNTACGGYELSPTGFGLRTSAVPVEAHAVPEGDSEFARIRWKTDQELLLGFIQAILPELVDADQENKLNIEGCAPREAAAKISLNDTEHRRILGVAIKNAREHMNEAEMPQSTGHKELLNIAELVTQNYYLFYQKVHDLENRVSIAGVEDASQAVRFPEGWDSTKDARQITSWEKLEFLFVKRVEFHLDSSDLRRLRAVLVDCPGLHASLWDNEVVRQSVLESDAIVWLQGGEGKELSKSDLDEANSFGNYGITSNRIFLAFNAKGASKKVAEEYILKSNLQKMRDALHLHIPEDRVVVFNALLALRALQGEKLNENDLPVSSIRALSDKALKQYDAPKLPDQGTNPEKNTEFLVKKDLRRLGDQFLGDELDNPLDPEMLAYLLPESQWDKVMTQASEFIVRTRGRTRLIDNGSARIEFSLKRCEEALEQLEKNAEKNVEEHKRAKNKAETALEEFDKCADALVRKFEDRGEYVEKLGGELNERLRREKEKSLIPCLLDSIDAAEQERDVRDLIQESAGEWMKDVIAGWQVDVRDGKSNTMNGFYQKIRQGVEDEMKKLLQEAIGQSEGLLRSVDFSLPSVNKQVLVNCNAVAMQSTYKHIDRLLDWVDRRWGGKFKPIRDGYEKVRELTVKDRFDRKEWKKRVEGDHEHRGYVDHLEEAWRKGLTSEEAKELLDSYVQAIIERIDDTKRKLRQGYEAQVASTESLLAEADKDRKAKAKEATRIRQEIIKPFREEVKAFEARVEDALKDEEVIVDTE